jgi:hypothetical protein
MNLNDPFNRLSRQQQSEYLKFRDSLKQHDITSLADANALLANIRQRALMIGSITISAAVLTVFFAPELKGIVLVFGVLILLWLFAVTIKGQRFMRRFITDEFPQDSESS